MKLQFPSELTLAAKLTPKLYRNFLRHIFRVMFLSEPGSTHGLQVM